MSGSWRLFSIEKINCHVIQCVSKIWSLRKMLVDVWGLINLIPFFTTFASQVPSRPLVGSGCPFSLLGTCQLPSDKDRGATGGRWVHLIPETTPWNITQKIEIWPKITRNLKFDPKLPEIWKLTPDLKFYWKLFSIVSDHLGYNFSKLDKSMIFN